MVRFEISIDHSRCSDPLGCGICLKICPTAVFVARPSQMFKFRETPGALYRIKPLYASMCTGCMECAVKCPAGAVRVERSNVR